MYTDHYFTTSLKVIKSCGLDCRVRYNVFIRKEGIVCGMLPVLRMLSRRNLLNTGREDKIQVRSLSDGDAFKSCEPIMLIEGPVSKLVELETAILGHLSLSGPATNMARLVDAAHGVPVVDMSARHYPEMPGLAYAAYTGDAAGTSVLDGWIYTMRLIGETVGNNLLENLEDKHNFRVYGSIPHALNAVSGGSLEAARVFVKAHPMRKLTVLNDYEGKEMNITRQAVTEFGDKLFAIRLDTHGGRIHQGGHAKDDLMGNGAAFSKLINLRGVSAIAGYKPDPRYLCGPGVTLEAYANTRDLLDRAGAHNVKIVLSSGFDEEKIREFRKWVDVSRTIFGTGSWVGPMDYHPTMDIVEIRKGNSWFHALKEGREYTPNERLEEVRLDT